MTNQPGSGGISLKGFEAASHGTEFSSYVSALESFDRLDQLQELKALGHERTGINAGAHCSRPDVALDWKHCGWLAWPPRVGWLRAMT
jgi:hypothetical protein